MTMTTDLLFPSEAHRQSLLGRIEAGGLKALDAHELLQFHAYRYAWRRVRLDDFTQRYGGDPTGQHFDGVFVGQATTWMRGGKAPPAATTRPNPTPEDIAHVAAACAQIRANFVVAADEHNRAAFRPRPMDPRDFEALQAGLGLRVTEEEMGDGEIAAQ
jgi:hypothetical protein